MRAYSLLPRLSKAKTFPLVISALWLFSSEVTAATFQGLGVLPGGEDRYSKPFDISDNGLVVVGESESANGIEAFRWTSATGMVGLGSLGGSEFRSSAKRVSANGSVVVGSSRSAESAPRVEAFRWTYAGGMEGLGFLPGGDQSSVASGVSADGAIVAGVSTSTLSPDSGEAFLWTEESGLVGLGTLDGADSPSSVPWGMSSDGTVVVGWSYSANGTEAFRWTEVAGMIGLGDLPGSIFDSRSADVSSNGEAIAGSGVGSAVRGFLWRESTGMVELAGPPGSSGSEAWGISDDGSVIVGDAALGGDLVPTIWTEAQGMRNLVDVLVELGLGAELATWDLEQAISVSGDGLTVTGWGYRGDGSAEAWIAYLGPTIPSVVEVPISSKTGLLLLGALLAMASIATLRRLKIRSGITW